MAQTITLDELVALNDEMLALVRAGVPLEQGLADVRHDVRGNLGRISGILAERMTRGETLPHILATSPEQFPPLYRAIVQAGIRSGRLAAALEETSASIRRLAALRRLVMLAMIYPLIVFFVCYGMFLFFAVKIAPLIYRAAPLEHPPVVLRAIASIHNGIEWWGAILPAIVLTLAIMWWYRSRQTLVLQTGGSARIFGWVPSFRRLLDETRAAGFAETLALLIDHDVPLSEAMTLAAEASGDFRLISAATRLADEVSAGIVKSNSAAANRETTDRDASGSANAAIPPMLQWLIATGARQPALGKALRDAADSYRRRAVRRADWLRVRLPVVLMLGIGGTVTVLYALALFVPWTSLLYELTKP
jgi:general secretion pathway protein F